MKRGFYFFAAGALALILTACGPNNNLNEEKTDTISEVNPTVVKSETITEENLEYYAYTSGSSSLCERFIIYEYKGEFIFAADYFNCGNEWMETYPLQKKEVELFLEEVNAVFAKEAEGKAEEEEAYSDGTHTEKGTLVVGGISYSVQKIDFEALGIDVTNAYEAEYPSKEEAAEYEIEGILELQETAQWKEQPVFIGSGEFQRSVGKQIEDRSGEEIERMVIEGFEDEDFMIKAEMKNGKSYRATVTYWGYVVKAEIE